MTLTARAAALAVGCALAAGCGGADNRPSGAQPTARDALDEVGQMLKAVAAENRKPPAKAAELEPVEPMIPTAAPQLRDGALVYVWGTPFAADGSKVAAYEKKAPAEGGWVLLQNGSVKELTAAEFAAAKAK